LSHAPAEHPSSLHIHCIGLNHTPAAVSLRESLALREEILKTALARLGRGCGKGPTINELVILSTCNRVELYAVSNEPGFSALEEFLAGAQGVPRPAFAGHLYRLAGLEAVRHLLHVAAGLDSLVLEEPQILRQVWQALELARSQDVAGPVLSRLFQDALHAGKRVRTETTIGHNPAPISPMQKHLNGNLSQPAMKISQAEAILEQVHLEFERFLAMMDVFPLIAAMHQRAEVIRRSELQKTLRRLPGLSEAEIKRLDVLTQSLINKLLHAPITCLRTAAGGPNAAEYSMAIRSLFDLGNSTDTYQQEQVTVLPPSEAGRQPPAG
jgi:glutamyl-tRNA reductase